MSSQLYVLTGPPGSGKTPIVNELMSMGFVGVAEAARAVIADEKANGRHGHQDRALFCELMLARCVEDFDRHRASDRPVFFDRAIPDLVTYAEGSDAIISTVRSAMDGRRYDDLVFFTPSWPEIYTTDEDRKATFEMCHRFGEGIRAVYVELGYTIVEVPKDTPAARARFVVETIGA